jgi:hypothetical protein
LALKDLERAFEIIQDADVRREQGAVYTPTFIIDHLVEEGLRLAGAGGSRGRPVICDPACGSGGFLVRAAEILAKRLGITLERAVERHLVGFDVNASALEHAAAFLDLFLMSQGRPRAKRTRLLAMDTLVSPGAEVLEAAGEPKGFGLVVTNPPYVKIQNLPEAYRRALEKRFPDLTFGSYALAPLALVAYLGLLAKKGCAAVITQNNLFTSLAGEPVRRHLQERGAIRRIVDFGHQHLFEGASAYTCLLFLSNEARTDFEYASVSDASEPGLRRAELTPIETAGLDPKKWRLGTPAELECLKKIESTGIPLGEAVRIKVGFATLKDAVFLVEGADASSCSAKGADGRTVRIEAALTRPAIKIAAANSEAEVASNAMRVIFPYERDGKKFRLIPERRLKAEFPLTYAYLREHRAALGSRDKGKRAYDGWYAWGRTQGMDAAGPKLLTRTFDSQPRFLYDPSDQLFCNGYALFPRETRDASTELRVLQALLESKTMHFYVKRTSFQLEGDFQCYQKNFIERFGVPRLKGSQRARLLSLAGAERERFIASLYGLRYDDLMNALRLPPSRERQVSSCEPRASAL